MDANSVLKRTILVVFAALLVAGNGMAQITVSNNSVALNNSTTFQTITVTSSTAFTFMVTETDFSGTPWLRAFVGSACNPNSMPVNCATGNGAVGNGASINTMTIQLNSGLLSQAHGTVALTPMGSTTAAATINVTFTPGSGGTSSTPVTPSSLTVAVANGGSATNSVTLQNNTGTAINITSVAPATSTDTWLTGSASPANVAVGGQSIITVNTTGTVFSNTTLTDSLVITIQNQPSVSVPVTFNIGTSSGISLSTVNVAFAYPNGNSQQVVAVSGVTAYSATASTTDGSPWLILSAGSQSGLQVANVPVTTQLNVVLGAAVTGLATGNYSGTVTVTDANNASNTATISVTLAVNGAATSIVVSPPPLSGTTPQINFYAQMNGSVSIPSQSLWISAPVGTFTAAVTSNNTPWLFLGTASGQIPGSLQVYALNVSGLAPNTYNGQITITAGSLTQVVNVVLIVTANPVAYGGFTTVTGTNGTVLFTSGGTSQQVAVFASDGPTDTLMLSGIQAPNWLTVTQNGNQLTITPNVSSQGAALDSGYVTLTATNAANTISNNPISIPVVLATGANGGILTITESQPLTFTSSSSGVTPSSVTVSVTAPTATSFTVFVPSSSSWINIPTGNSFLTSQNFTVSVNPGTLAPSNTPYTGEIDFTANGVTQKLPVSLTVTGGSNGGNVSADQSMLTFTAVAGGQAQGLPVNITSNSAAVPFTVAVSVQGAGTWLSSDTSSASTPKRVTITADPTTLSAGIYQGTVTITASNTVTIPVMFTVQAPPMVSAGATNLTFTYFSGGSAPPAQTVSISGSTGGFTATAASDTGNWLTVTPASGSVGTSISVSANPTGIAIGSHTGTVTIAGTNGLTGQVVINVSLTITAPLPSVTSVGNGASYAQGQVAPGEVLTLFGTGLGPATPVTAQVVNGNLTTQLGGVQVLVSGVLAPMIYASATQVSAVVPYEVARFPVAAVGIKYLGQTSNIVSLPVVPTAPGIFTQNQSGTGAVGFNGDFSVNGPNNPAPKGSTMVFFLTGEGQTNPAGVTGTINSTPNMNPMPVAPITVTIDSQPTTYSYAGGIEGVVEGIMQLNVVVPASARSGTVPIMVTIGANGTQSGVTVSVK
jgi:uncharacterized protein (TIGR03437 family)